MPHRPITTKHQAIHWVRRLNAHIVRPGNRPFSRKRHERLLTQALEKASVSAREPLERSLEELRQSERNQPRLRAEARSVLKQRHAKNWKNWWENAQPRLLEAQRQQNFLTQLHVLEQATAMARLPSHQKHAAKLWLAFVQQRIGHRKARPAEAPLVTQALFQALCLMEKARAFRSANAIYLRAREAGVSLASELEAQAFRKDGEIEQQLERRDYRSLADEFSNWKPVVRRDHAILALHWLALANHASHHGGKKNFVEECYREAHRHAHFSLDPKNSLQVENEAGSLGPRLRRIRYWPRE